MPATLPARITEAMKDDTSGNRRSSLTGHEKTEDRSVFLEGTEGKPLASWVGKGACDVVFSALTSRE